MRRVLVIDDHTGIREILRETLEAVGYDVAVAGNGREGLEIQRRQPADLVITDIFMPEKEGRVIGKPFDCEAMAAAVRELLGETG